VGGDLVGEGVVKGGVLCKTEEYVLNRLLK
jgi:hypothetical protein